MGTLICRDVTDSGPIVMRGVVTNYFQSVTSARPFFRNIRHLERCIMTYVGIRIGIASRFDYLNEF